MSPIFTPSSIFRPCLSKAFLASLATCSSTAARKVGMPSSTVTSAPRRRQTLPISRPITPEPITPSFFGTALTARSTVVGQDLLLVKLHAGQGAGIGAGGHDDLLGHQGLGVLPVTWISYPPSTALLKAPRPWKKVTLFFLNRYRMPSLFCLTMASLRAIILLTSMATLPVLMPCSSKCSWACSKCSDDCSSALEGMQPTLVQVPPGAAPPWAFWASSIQATFMPSWAARMAAM